MYVGLVSLRQGVHGQGEVQVGAFQGLKATDHTVGVKTDVDVREVAGLRQRACGQGLTLPGGVMTGVEFNGQHGRHTPHDPRQIVVVLGRIQQQQIQTHGLGPVAGVFQTLKQLGVAAAFQGPATQGLKTAIVDSDQDDVVVVVKALPSQHPVVEDIPPHPCRLRHHQPCQQQRGDGGGEYPLPAQAALFTHGSVQGCSRPMAINSN